MGLEYNIFSVVLLVSGIAALLMSVMVFRRLGGAVRWYGFAMLLIAIWAIFYAFELSSKALAEMLFWINIEYLGIALLPAIWIVFILKFVEVIKITLKFQESKRVLYASRYTGL